MFKVLDIFHTDEFWNKTNLLLIIVSYSILTHAVLYHLESMDFFSGVKLCLIGLTSTKFLLGIFNFVHFLCEKTLWIFPSQKKVRHEKRKNNLIKDIEYVVL